MATQNLISTPFHIQPFDPEIFISKDAASGSVGRKRGPNRQTLITRAVIQEAVEANSRLSTIQISGILASKNIALCAARVNGYLADMGYRWSPLASGHYGWALPDAVDFSGYKSQSKANREEYQRAFQVNWIKSRRTRWIEENGPCSQCNSTEDLRVISTGPEKRILWSLSPKSPRLQAVLKHCKVICKKCLSAVHREKMEKIFSERHQQMGRRRAFLLQEIQFGYKSINEWVEWLAALGVENERTAVARDLRKIRKDHPEFESSFIPPVKGLARFPKLKRAWNKKSAALKRSKLETAEEIMASVPEELLEKVKEALRSFKSTVEIMSTLHVDTCIVSAASQYLASVGDVCICGKNLGHEFCFFLDQVTTETSGETASVPLPYVPDPTRCSGDRACVHPIVADGMCRYHLKFSTMEESGLGGELDLVDIFDKEEGNKTAISLVGAKDVFYVPNLRFIAPYKRVGRQAVGA